MKKNISQVHLSQPSAGVEQVGAVVERGVQELDELELLVDIRPGSRSIRITHVKQSLDASVAVVESEEVKR
jgi:hypothetical protein